MIRFWEADIYDSLQLIVKLISVSGHFSCFIRIPTELLLGLHKHPANTPFLHSVGNTVTTYFNEFQALIFNYANGFPQKIKCTEP